MEASFLHPFFIGAHAENHELFERLLLEFVRDHAYWRRNFHPADPPPIPTASELSPEYQDFVARVKRELLALSAALKNSIPLFSPRYVGHMLSDPLMPGLLAQMITLPYNPNNVSEEAAPVTVDLEVEVGLQLARMLGFDSDPARTPCAFGHLTSGGTVANYEALWVLRSMKYFPLALRSGLARAGVPTPTEEPLSVLAEGTRRLINLSPAETISLRESYLELLANEPDAARRHAVAAAVHEERVETLGVRVFFARHRDAPPPVIFLPATAHYSWSKAVKLLGMGEEALVSVPLRGMRMDARALEGLLAAAHKIEQSVMCVVGVLGSTEFGTFDPIDQLVAARDHWHQSGLGFAVHVDAAWGGYLATMFRGADGKTLERGAAGAGLRYFPSQKTHAAFAALGASDSVTVDPHKLGYLPYGVGGAFVCRDHRCMDFVAEDPAYLGPSAGSAGHAEYRRKFRRLGRFILEGSKPGAAAAAAYVTHKVLPLDARNFGRLLRHGVEASEYFFDRVLALRQRVAGLVRVTIPVEPDCNLVCVAFNPVGNRAAAGMNAFTDKIFDKLRVDPDVPMQAHTFFGSSTVLQRRLLSAADRECILGELDIDPNTFRDPPIDPERDAAGLRVLRHTLMNPWLRDEANGIDYVEMYCRYLEDVLRQEAGRDPADPLPKAAGA